MVGINIRSGVDLKTVVILVGVLEEAVHRIKDFVREEEEPLPEIKETFLASIDIVRVADRVKKSHAHEPRHSAVIKAFLASEYDVEPPP